MQRKLIAMYLPQFHEIPENNEWWGKGHTEWFSCKRAVPRFPGHYQPRIPLNGYYDLKDVEVQIQQAEIAKKYGIYGFCYYHYWFQGKLLLNEPAENMLNNEAVAIPFCFSWANHSWVNKIERAKRKTLMSQTYGKESDWEMHFDYLYNFFVDDRYIKIDNKPVFIIYNSKHIPSLREMMSFWSAKAKKLGFSGVFFVNTLKDEKDIRTSSELKFDAQFEYQPTFALSRKRVPDYSWYYHMKRIIMKDIFGRVSTYSYDKVWNLVIKRTPKNGVTTFLGSFVDWDITPRWSDRGLAFKGGDPDKFKKHLSFQLERSKMFDNSSFLFITAWNEWSEGAYLEPDLRYNYAYLEAVREALIETGNWVNDPTKVNANTNVPKI